MSERINEIRTLLARGKEYKALHALVDLLKAEKNGSDFLNTAFLLQSRLDGMETKFNQGITSYEKWEISRNKILKSTLDFIDKVETALSLANAPAAVDKMEVEAATAIPPTFIHRLADPELIRKMAFYYLILWVFLGAWDTLFFQVRDPALVEQYRVLGIAFNKYVVGTSTVTWLKDFIGHLFAFGTAILTIMLGIVQANLAKTSSLVLQKVNELYRKFFFPFLLLGIGLAAAAVIANANYTTQQSSVQLWSAEISPGFLPPFIAGNYFILVVIPLVLGILYYCLLLHVSIKEFKSFTAYNPFHGDRSFGLLWVGRSIFWGTLAFVVLMLSALILQLVFKAGELTAGIFLGTILFFILIWFGAINPLRKLSAKLGLEKARLYESVKEEVRSNNRMLGHQSSAEDLQTVKLLLDASRDNERELLELHTLPINWYELLIGGGIVLLLLGIIVYQIS